MTENEHSDRKVADYLIRLRNQERVELIMAFYRGLKEFRDLTRKGHSGKRRFRFEDIDHLIEGHLRSVKDSGHRLFRQSKRGPEDGVLQAIFDMHFGVLFHILLKAKENIRLQENYNIRRLDKLINGMGNTDRARQLPPDVAELFESLKEEFEQDTHELQGEIERARFMFSRLEKIFNRIIQVYDDNATIIRSLYCQKAFFAELFPGQGVERLFARIYPKNGPTEAYFLLGFDYLRSGHTDEAREAFLLALKAARVRHIHESKLRKLFERYRDKSLETTSESGDLALALHTRLRDIESDRSLRRLFTNADREPVGGGADRSEDYPQRPPMAEPAKARTD